MSTESKQEQIERLKKNDLGYYALSKSDQELIDKLWREKQVCQRYLGTWAFRATSPIDPDDVYRISINYQPEPDTPEFPGYELYEVKPDDTGRLVFTRNDYTDYLDMAPRFGCAGYVPKEKFNGYYELAESPISFKNKSTGQIYGSVSQKELASGNYASVPLGWVAFREAE